MPKSFFYASFFLLVYVLPHGSCFGMERIKEFKNEQKVTSLSPRCQTAFALLQNAYSRNDTQLFKTLITEKLQLTELEPLWPVIMKLSTRHLPTNFENPENNPQFGRIVDGYNKKHESPLHFAARRNELENLKKYITPQNINLKNLNGETPLFCAVHSDYYEATQLLLEAGALVSPETHTGIRPLHTAFKLPICKLLCEYGARADINHRDIFSQTPLFYVIGQGYADVAQYLIEQGSDINICNMLGETILQGSCFTEFLKPSASLALCKKLLKAGALVNAQSNDYRTALHVAIENKLHEHAQALILAGADITLASRWNETPAMLIEDVWNMPADEFVKLCFQPDFKERMHAHIKECAKKSFEVKVKLRGPLVTRTKKSPKTKNRPTYNQRKAKLINTLKKEVAPSISGESGHIQTNTQPSQPSFELAQRVLDWQDNEWLLQKELRAKQDGSYEYWKFLRKRIYHRLPSEALSTIMRYGIEMPRANKTHSNHVDTQFVLEGEMQFKYNDNPWQPGKRCQRGFYHMTRGIDGKIYHVGFKPIGNQSKNLGDFIAPIPIEWESQEAEYFSAVFDSKEGIRHVLYH